jgi:L-fuconolactonase
VEIIDAQLHAWRADCAEYPWDPRWGRGTARLEAVRKRMSAQPIEAEHLIAMMRAVGVDAALLASVLVYGADHSYAFDCAAAHPGVFGVVGPVDPSTPEVEDYVAGFRTREHGIGVRAVFVGQPPPTAEVWAPIFRGAARGDVPVFVFPPGDLPSLAEVARVHPDVTLIVDHLGHLDPPLDRLDDLLALARFPNVSVKCTAAHELSRDPYPFSDLWPPLARLFEAFGLERVMWGSDITRARSHSYCDALGYLRHTDRLTEEEKAMVLGGSLRQVLRWPQAATRHGSISAAP